jgi:hypothetical protein
MLTSAGSEADEAAGRCWSSSGSQADGGDVSRDGWPGDADVPAEKKLGWRTSRTARRQ